MSNDFRADSYSRVIRLELVVNRVEVRGVGRSQIGSNESRNLSLQ